MQLKLADKIENSNIRNSSVRRQHELRNEVDSETPNEKRNAKYSTVMYNTPWTPLAMGRFLAGLLFLLFFRFLSKIFQPKKFPV